MWWRISFILLACAITGFRANDCGEDERYCTIDNKCIPGFFWCDAYSVPDCTDEEDEKDCSASDCANTGTFHCDQSMTCTEMSNRCDGAPDCQDGEDEQNCEDYVCHSGQMKCEDHSCVWGVPCNGKKDCKDGSDEVGCQDFECPVDKLRCSDFTCVWGQRCDGYDNCQDKSDEVNCEDYVCPVGKLECDDHTCTWGEKCDGAKNCVDGSDEKNCHEYTCPAAMMKCGDGTCANGYPCDGTENCVDGSDEHDCTGCIEGAFFCHEDKRCIPDVFVCDSWADCSDAEDDRGCGFCSEDEFMCSNEDCIQYQNKICNDEDDCGDNSDERGCKGVEPIPDIFPMPLILPAPSFMENLPARRYGGYSNMTRTFNNKDAYKRFMTTGSRKTFKTQQSMFNSYMMRQQIKDRDTYKRIMLAKAHASGNKHYIRKSTSGTADMILKKMQSLKRHHYGDGPAINKRITHTKQHQVEGEKLLKNRPMQRENRVQYNKDYITNLKRKLESVRRYTTINDHARLITSIRKKAMKIMNLGEEERRNGKSKQHRDTLKAIEIKLRERLANPNN